MDKENNIDIFDVASRFLKCFRRFWAIVAVLAVLGGALSLYRAHSSFIPYYEAKARFAVTSSLSTDDIFQSSTFYNNSAAEQLAATFPQLISTEMMRDLMLEKLGTSYVNGSVTASTVAETNIFVLTCRSTVAEDAYDILNAVIDCYPLVAVYMIDDSRIVILDPPAVPSEAANSFSWKAPLIKGCAVGCVLGLAVILMLTVLSKTVNTHKDLREVANVPLLATLPLVTKKKRRSGVSPISHLQDQDYAESVRGLRIKLKRAMPQNARVIMLTSTLENEGKSSICVSLAASLARDGHRVVIVDGDLRKQDLREIFNETEETLGLTDVLEDPSIGAFDCIRYSAQYPDVAYISGSRRSDGHLSFDHKVLLNFFIALRKSFDYVIVDTPPCAVVSDTGILCRYAEGIVYVVRQDHARRNAIIDGIDSLAAKNAHIIGWVLNGVEKGTGRYGYGYGYGYKYGYGYRSGYGYGYKKYGYKKYGYDSRENEE